MKNKFLVFMILGSLTLAACSSGSDEDCVTVTTNGETSTICGNLDEIAASGGSSAGSESSDSVTGTTSSDGPHLESFSGTWCFDSGTPYYLAIIIDDNQSAAEVAYYVDNSRFLNDGALSEDFVFTSRSFSASSSAELGSLQTFNTSNVSEIENYADVEFSNNHEQIIVDFGGFIAGYEQSSTDGSCVSLTVTEDEKDRLENL